MARRLEPFGEARRLVIELRAMLAEKILAAKAKPGEDRQGALGPLRRDRIAALQHRLAAAQAFVEDRCCRAARSSATSSQAMAEPKPCRARSSLAQPSNSCRERGLLDRRQIPLGDDQPEIALADAAQKHGIVRRRLGPSRLQTEHDNFVSRAGAADGAAASGQERRRARSARCD